MGQLGQAVDATSEKRAWATAPLVTERAVSESVPAFAVPAPRLPLPPLRPAIVGGGLLVRPD